MTENVWNNLIDSIQAIMLGILIIVVAICILALIFFDVLVGTGVMMYLTGDDLQVSVFISLSTSGLLISLMFIGQSLTSSGKSSKFGFGAVILVIAFGVYCLDVYFDSLTADYLRFGQIILLDTLPKEDIHVYFRTLIGGISTIGESLAIGIILGMPVLKSLVSNALPKSHKTKAVNKSFKRTTRADGRANRDKIREEQKNKPVKTEKGPTYRPNRPRRNLNDIIIPEKDYQPPWR